MLPSSAEKQRGTQTLQPFYSREVLKLKPTAILTVETIQLTSGRRGRMLVPLSLVKLHQLRLTYLCFTIVQVTYESDKQIDIFDDNNNNHYTSME